MEEEKSLVDQVRELQVKIAPQKQLSTEILRLSEFYQTMKDRGLIRKQEYNLPQLDTIGAESGAHPSSNVRFRKNYDFVTQKERTQ